MGGGETEVQVLEGSSNQSRKGSLTFEWKSLSPALLRAFLFFDYDDNAHGSNVGRSEVDAMETDELINRVEEYDRHVDLSNGGKRSWAHDLLETLKEGDNGDAFGLTLADHQRLAGLATSFQRQPSTPRPKRRQPSPPREKSKQPEKTTDKEAQPRKSRKGDETRSRRPRSPPGRMPPGASRDELERQLHELQSETVALKAAQMAATKAHEQPDDEGRTPRKESRRRRDASRSPPSKRARSRGRDRRRSRRSRSSSSSSSSRSSSSSSRSGDSSSDSSRSSSRASSSASSSSASSSSPSSSRSRSRDRARRARARSSRKTRRSRSSRKSASKRRRQSKRSKHKSKKLSKAEASRKIRTSKKYMFRRLWAKVHSTGVSEANDLSGFFASVTSQLRMEAKGGERKTKAQLEKLTDWLEAVREETVGSFRRQVRPIAASRDIVSLAEEQLCLHLRGEVEQSNFLRDIDWRKVTMRGISKVVAPLVKDESKRLVQSRGQQPRLDRFGSSRQDWAAAGESWGGRGGGKHGGKGGGKGHYANMAWTKDGSRPISCWHCGQLGHYSNECPTKGGPASAVGVEGQKRQGGGTAGGVAT